MPGPCRCEACRRVIAHLQAPRMTSQPAAADRYTHARHIVRDNQPPPEREDQK